MSDDQIFTSLQTIAKGWRCWDRTEVTEGTEQRIVDGAAWGILYAIKEGKVNGLTLTPVITDEMVDRACAAHAQTANCPAPPGHNWTAQKSMLSKCELDHIRMMMRRSLEAALKP